MEAVHFAQEGGQQARLSGGCLSSDEVHLPGLKVDVDILELERSLSASFLAVCSLLPPEGSIANEGGVINLARAQSGQ